MANRFESNDSKVEETDDPIGDAIKRRNDRAASAHTKRGASDMVMSYEAEDGADPPPADTVATPQGPRKRTREELENAYKKRGPSDIVLEDAGPMKLTSVGVFGNVQNVKQDDDPVEAARARRDARMKAACPK